MYETKIAIAAGQALTLKELAGNARLEGYDGTEVIVRLPDGVAEDVIVEQAENGPVVTVRADCELQVPAGIPISLRQAQGNLRAAELASLDAEQVRGNLKLGEVDQVTVAEVYGNLKAAEAKSLRVVGTVYGDVSLAEIETVDIQNIRGNLRAREVGRLRVSRVAGNLAAKEIGGALEVDQVGGNAILKEVGGMARMEQVAGNLVAKHLGGGANVARIGGNLVFAGIVGIGRSYHFRADGNAMLQLEEDAAAHVSVSAGGHLHSSLVLTGEERTAQALSGLLNDGGAELAVHAEGNLLLGIGGQADHEAPDDLGERFGEEMGQALGASFGEMGRQMEASFDNIGRQVESEIESSLGRLRVKLEGMDWARIGGHAQASVERAMSRLEQESGRLAERMAHHQERIRLRAQREALRAERDGMRAHRHERTAGAVAAAPLAGAEPVPDVDPEPDRDQERLTILKMVQQGQITPREAEMLLEALD